MSTYIHILPLNDQFLSQTENLIKNHSDIFSENDLIQFKHDLNSYLAMDRHMADQGLAFIVVIDKTVCGIIMYQKDQYAHNAYRINWLVIKNDQQNKGYGTRLVKEVFKKIKEAGGKHVYLETSNARHNKHAKKFYEDLGFKKVGVLPDYYDPPIKFPRKLEDGIIYHREL